VHRLHFSEENNPGKYAVCTSQIFQKSSNTSRLKAKKGIRIIVGLEQRRWQTTDMGPEEF
jgi:hypothetical protein